MHFGISGRGDLCLPVIMCLSLTFRVGGVVFQIGSREHIGVDFFLFCLMS